MKVLLSITLSLFLCAASFADLKNEDFPNFEDSINDNVITHKFKITSSKFFRGPKGEIIEYITLKKDEFILKCKVVSFGTMGQETVCWYP